MTHRIEQVNKLLRRELSELLQHEVKDPRLGGFISVTDVTASPDLKHAKVFVSHIGSDAEKREIIEVLESASGFLRSEMSHRLKLRRIPELSFKWDDSIKHGDYILRLFEETTKENSP